MHARLHIVTIAVLATISTVSRTKAAILPYFNRWTKESMPSVEDENLFDNPDMEFGWMGDEEASDTFVIEYITPPKKQCGGTTNLCVVTQKLRLTICSSETSDDCIPSSWDDYICSSIVTTANTGFSQQRCRRAADTDEKSQNSFRKPYTGKDIYVKKWGFDEPRIDPF